MQHLSYQQVSRSFTGGAAMKKAQNGSLSQKVLKGGNTKEKSKYKIVKTGRKTERQSMRANDVNLATRKGSTTTKGESRNGKETRKMVKSVLCAASALVSLGGEGDEPTGKIDVKNGVTPLLVVSGGKAPKDSLACVADGRSSPVNSMSSHTALLGKLHGKVDSVTKNDLNEGLLRFPEKLRDVLARDEFSDIIAWHPNGCAFFIINPLKLVSDVLPKFFMMTRFTAFYRALLRWGFHMVTKGAESGAFFHEFFQRDNVQLSKRMCIEKGAAFQLSDVIPSKSKECKNDSATVLQKIEHSKINAKDFLKHGSDVSLSTSRIMSNALEALRNTRSTSQLRVPMGRQARAGVVVCGNDLQRQKLYSIGTLPLKSYKLSPPTVSGILSGGNFRTSLKSPLMRQMGTAGAQHRVGVCRSSSATGEMCTKEIIKNALDVLERSGENVSVMRRSMLDSSNVTIPNALSEPRVSGVSSCPQRERLQYLSLLLGKATDQPISKRANAA